MLTATDMLRLKELAEHWKGRFQQQLKSADKPRVFRKLVEEDAPITCYDRDRIRSVRCENCAKVLPYGTRPCIQKDDPDAPNVYLCKYCKSGHEDKLFQEASPDDKLKVKVGSRPPPRVCESVIVYHENGSVKNVLIGCKQKTSEWSEHGTRVLLHHPRCQAFRETMRSLLSNATAPTGAAG